MAKNSQKKSGAPSSGTEQEILAATHQKMVRAREDEIRAARIARRQGGEKRTKVVLSTSPFQEGQEEFLARKNREEKLQRDLLLREARRGFSCAGGSLVSLQVVNPLAAQAAQEEIERAQARSRARHQEYFRLVRLA